MRSEGVHISVLFTNIVLTSNNYIKYDIMIETDFHMDWYPETNFIHSMIPRYFEKHSRNCNMHAWIIFFMMWLHWSTLPAKFSSYHWNLICTEYSYHKHGRAYQRFPIYIRLIFKDFLNSWYHYKFVFKLSLRIFHQLHNRRWNYSAVGYTCVSKRLFVYHLKRSKALLARILFVMRQNLIFSLIVIIHVIFKSLGFETVISIKKLDTAPSPLLWLIFPIWFILDE